MLKCFKICNTTLFVYMVKQHSSGFFIIVLDCHLKGSEATGCPNVADVGPPLAHLCHVLWRAKCRGEVSNSPIVIF